MTNRIKTSAALMTLTAGLFLAPLANAQDAYLGNFNNSRSVSTTAGLHMTIPFGGKKSDHVQDRARFGLMLNMTREYNDRNFYTPKRVNTNLLDFGMQFDGRPTMLISGEDMYTPLFAPLNANGDADSKGGINISKNTVLLAAGAALAIGAAAALAGGGGEDDDDYDGGRDNDD